MELILLSLVTFGIGYLINEVQKLNNYFNYMSESYSEKELTEFGEYLLSDERRKYFEDTYKDDDEIGLEERLKQVYHRDFEEWKNK